MATTRLSVIAVPGKPYSFVAKGSVHTGRFTELSVIALPGMRHAFVAKTAAIIEVGRRGYFVRLKSDVFKPERNPKISRPGRISGMRKPGKAGKPRGPRII